MWDQPLSTPYLPSMPVVCMEIRAGVRKADKLKSISNVSVVKAEMGNAELQNTLKGVHALFIVSPPVENRAALTIATAEYAKKTGVKHQVVLATLTTGKKDTILGAQLSEIETAVKGLGVPYTLLGLPFFYENNFGFKDTIKGASAIYTPVDPTKTFGQVAVADIGNAAAAILADPAPHIYKQPLRHSQQLPLIQRFGCCIWRSTGEKYHLYTTMRMQRSHF